MSKREGNRPGRRIAPAEFTDPGVRRTLAERLRYVGSGHHKLHPGDYGLHPPSNPRASKTPCDDLRPLLLREASDLFRRGIALGMVSRFSQGAVPKYVWAVDENGQAYESKTKPEGETDYHGYRLGEDDPMRSVVLTEWRRRCPQD
jgi:hypothetical protein